MQNLPIDSKKLHFVNHFLRLLLINRGGGARGGV